MARLARPTVACATLFAAILATVPAATAAGLRAGAATSNITPPLGEPIIGGFHPFPATHVHDELHARCLVLDDGTTRLALVVCDLLGLHGSVGDEARRLIAAETGIPPEHVLVSATHTHSATSALGGAALERFDAQQPALTPYQAFVARRIADGVRRATNLARPAELAWGTVEVPEHLFNRRWFMRPGTMPENPFGTATDLVKMNPPAGSPNLDRPAGPIDPTLPFFVVREPAGPPIGLFAAYSLHYVGGVGAGHVSADYFGVVCDELARLFAGGRAGSPFVALLANGTSGDVNNIDFRSPRPPAAAYERIEAVGRDVAGKIHAAAGGLEFQREVPLAARFRTPAIASRRPTAEELAWARRTLEKPAPAGERKSLAEIYAERVLALEQQPEALPLPLQLLAIGDGRLGTMPCEVFTEIGLEFRRRCPGRPATLVSLAHGYLGYLPTPRQHDFGGYETWPGTNRLARGASETMLEALLEMAAELPPAAAAPEATPPSPDAARSHLQTDPGLVVELAAAEPQVVDPVAIAFDEGGRMWVAEMGEYPGWPASVPAGGVGRPGDRPGSRIRVLEDRDGDGRYEMATLFADGLAFVTGLQPWRRGAIVTLAGEVAWLADTDGDGRFDRHETLFTGFAEENSQLRANHPTLGPDGLVYVANGLRGGAVVAARHRAGGADAPQPLDIRGRDFRFDPRGGGWAAVTGHGQFGMSIDDFGTRFVCSNRNPCLQVMLEADALARQPKLALATAVWDVSPPAEASRLRPLSRAWTTSNLHAGQFTAACGVTIHRGDGLPAGYRGSSFTCDPTGNLVHRDRLRRSGPAFVAVPSAGPEFLASPHDWFRPVSLADGPDGCLYVVDMCRAVIEHPEFMPEELRARADLRAGADRGRIYRLRAADRHRRPTPRLSAAPPAELVQLLDHPDGWHRDTAARLLLERDDRLTVEELAAVAAVATDGRLPEGRARALFLLDSLGRLDGVTLGRTLADPHPRVRETSLKVAGPPLATAPGIATQVLAAAEDPEAAVRFEAAVRLGDVPPEFGLEAEVVQALAGIATAAADDRWTRAAVATACSSRAGAVLAAVVATATATATPPRPAGEPGAFDALVAELAAAGGEDVLPAVAAVQGQPRAVPSLETARVAGLGRGFFRRQSSLEAAGREWPAESREWLAAVLARAAERAADATAGETERVAAIGVLARAGFATAGPTLAALVGGERIEAVRLAAIAALASQGDPAADACLVSDEFHRWLAGGTPAVRRALVDAACGRPARADRLVGLVERGLVPRAAIPAEQWNRLGGMGDADFRDRVARVRETAAADRLAVIARYEPALSLAGDVSRGRVVFATHCAGCHRVGDLGVNVGPDISDSRSKQPAQYLVDILDPNRAIDASSFATTVVLTDGRVLTGLIAAQAAGSLTLRRQDGGTDTLLETEIEELATAAVSFMPVGFEREIDLPQMADLIAFLKGWRYAADH